MGKAEEIRRQIKDVNSEIGRIERERRDVCESARGDGAKMTGRYGWAASSLGTQAAGQYKSGEMSRLYDKKYDLEDKLNDLPPWER